MAQSFRMSRWRVLRHVTLPQLTPYVFAAARSGVALIWKIVLVVELLGRSNGVGFQIQIYFQLFDVTLILAYTVAFILVVQAIEWTVTATPGKLGHTMEEVILRLRIEGKSFETGRGNLPVLGSIDLTLGAREIVALVGPSGCGKTTLLRIIGSLDAEFQGTLEWRDATMPRIGTVFQEPRLLPWRTVQSEPAAGTADRTAGYCRSPVAHAGSCAVQRRVSSHAVARHGTAGCHSARLRNRA